MLGENVKVYVFSSAIEGELTINSDIDPLSREENILLTIVSGSPAKLDSLRGVDIAIYTASTGLDYITKLSAGFAYEPSSLLTSRNSQNWVEAVWLEG